MRLLKRTVASSISTVFLITGCAQLRNVPLVSADGRSGQTIARPEVQVGDQVQVTTRDGIEHKFQVTAMDAEAMRGASERIAYADMQRLEVREAGTLRPGKTALIIGAVLVGAAAIGAASGGGSSGGY